MSQPDWAARAQAAAEELYARAPEHQLRPRLEPTSRAAAMLGDPQRNYPIIHIAGTNGKTTTARIIERILRETGLRTGRFTSPHLVNLNERIALGGEPISDEEFVLAYEESKPLLELVDQSLVAEGEHPLTFFEAFTALAFQIFSDYPVDVLVLEVGMGGAWDSTNVADGDVTVFTPISLDHQKSLGSTVAEIAKTKAGIIKPKSIVISGPQEPEVWSILQAAASQSEGYLQVDKDFNLVSASPDGTGTRFTVRGLAANYPDLWMPIIGEHQAENATTALAAVEAFLGLGVKPLGDPVLRAALSDAISPGRLQVISKQPLEVLDGAHNPAGAKTLAAAIDWHFGRPKIIGVMAMLSDKDARAILFELKDSFDTLIVTEVESPRALAAADLANVAEEFFGNRVILGGTPTEAIQLARRLAIETQAAVFATGSLYMVGDLLREISEQEK